LGDPLKGNLLLLYKPLHLEAQQVSTRIEVRRHHKSVIAGLIEDMHELLSLIPGFEISKIDRVSNSVAHELAIT
jgi:hypothetical protein